MQGPPIDMAALNDATADLMKLANGDRPVIAMLKLESEGEAMLEKNMTPSERAARAAKQDAHAAKPISFLEYFAIFGGVPASPKIVPIMRHGVEPPPRPRRYDIRYVQEQ
jgi:hypothetical protein